MGTRLPLTKRRSRNRKARLMSHLKRLSFQKKSAAMKRIYNSPEYKAWRRSVFVRDNFACIMCGSDGYVEGHHILRKWDYPALVFNMHNGVTLCGPSTNKKSCHGKVTGKEYKYITKIMSKMGDLQRAQFRHILKKKGVKHGPRK